MQDMIEDVKELFLLQSSRPYNMMSERERERERESFCASIGRINTYPTSLKTKFITLFMTLLFSFSFSCFLTLYLLYLAPTSIVEVYPCPRYGHCFEASHWF
jgi:hypothetical protein